MAHSIKLNHLLKVIYSEREIKLLRMQRSQDLDLNNSTDHSNEDAAYEKGGDAWYDFKGMQINNEDDRRLILGVLSNDYYLPVT